MRAVCEDRLWLGTALDVRDLRGLYDAGVRAVVDLALEEPPAQLGREIAYLRFPLMDGPGNDPRLLRLAVMTIRELVRAEVPTLVACSGGMSRSPSLLAAAMARLESRSPDECLLELLRGQPGDVSPHLWRDLQSVVAGG